MNRFISYIIPLLIISFYFSSCGWGYKDVEIKQISNVQIKNFSSKGMDIFMDAAIHNPNSYDITLTETDVDVFLNGKKYGKAVIKKNIKLPGNTTTRHQFQITTTYENMMNNGLDRLLNLIISKKQKLKLEGTVHARVFFITKKIPFTLEQTVSIQK